MFKKKKLYLSFSTPFNKTLLLINLRHFIRTQNQSMESTDVNCHPSDHCEYASFF